ncbi:MAG: phosphate transport system permease protein [Solirubrobacterales bacterium]|nr:phosphate transport system permease protein [Solirubrobacterales bacterium]
MPQDPIGAGSGVPEVVPEGAGGLAVAGTGGGPLPEWTPYTVTGGAAALIALLLAATGSFSIVLMFVLTVVISLPVIYVWSRIAEGPRRALDRLATLSIVAAFGIAVAPLISLLYEVIKRGTARFDSAFFTESARGVVGAGGGAEHAIVGTLVITGVATLISVPIGIMGAIYLNEYGTGRLRRALTFFVDVMTGIPSIVAGLFAYAAFAVFLGPGIRLGIIGSVALSVLMIPIVIRTSEEILKIVPNHLREAAYALGTPKWKTVTRIVLPTALAGLVTGVMLSIARVIGETAPLLVTTGVVDSLNTDPVSGRMQNLAVYAYTEYKNPGVMKQAAYDRAWAAALTLIAIVMILSLIARFIYRRFGTEIR